MTERDEHPSDFLPELALGVLPAPDTEALHLHIASCATCRAEYEEMSRVANMLPLAAVDVEPDAAVRDALMERIAREPRPLLRSRRGPGLPRWWGAAAAALLVASAGAGGFLLGRDGGDGPGSGSREAALIEAAARGTLVSTRFSDGDASATFLRAPGQSAGFAWVQNLPPLPSGKAYQAWFIRGAAAEPSTVFSTVDGGVWLHARSDVAEYSGIGLTVEDLGGADSPSQAPFMLISLETSARNTR